MSFRQYDEKGNPIRKSVVLVCPEEENRTEQHHKDEVNINNIVKRHGHELIAKTAALQQFKYDDVVGNDFQETMNIIIKAQDSFQSVPSDIRKQFNNNPAEFMDYIHNPENKEQLVAWGMMEPEQEIQPMHVIVENPPPVETPPDKEPAP